MKSLLQARGWIRWPSSLLPLTESGDHGWSRSQEGNTIILTSSTQHKKSKKGEKSHGKEIAKSWTFLFRKELVHGGPAQTREEVQLQRAGRRDSLPLPAALLPYRAGEAGSQDLHVAPGDRIPCKAGCSPRHGRLLPPHRRHHAAHAGWHNTILTARTVLEPSPCSGSLEIALSLWFACGQNRDRYTCGPGRSASNESKVTDTLWRKWQELYSAVCSPRQTLQGQLCSLVRDQQECCKDNRPKPQLFGRANRSFLRSERPAGICLMQNSRISKVKLHFLDAHWVE